MQRVSDEDIFRAVALGHKDLLLSYIRCGIDLNIRDQKGSPLLHVAINRDQVEMVRVLISAGANPNIINGDSNFSSIHIAAAKKYSSKNNGPAMLKALLNHHPRTADINQAAINGITALHVATNIKDEESIKVLLLCGADPFLNDLSGRSAFDIFQEHKDKFTDKTLFAEVEAKAEAEAEAEAEAKRKSDSALSELSVIGIEFDAKQVRVKPSLSIDFEDFVGLGLDELDVLLEFGGGLAAAGDLPSGESVEKPAAAGDLPSGEGVENPAAAVATTGFVQNTPSF